MSFWKEQTEKFIHSYDELKEPIRTITIKALSGGDLSEEEWFELREQVRAFVRTNPSKEDLDELRGAAETISMACSAIEEIRKRKNGKR